MDDRYVIPARIGKTTSSRVVVFGRDDRGATAVEFAFVVFPLLTVILLVLEVGLTYWTSAILDNGVQSAVRIFHAETAASSSSTADLVRTEICQRGGGLINCDRLKVDLAYFSDLATVDISSPVDAAAKTWRAGFGTSHGCTPDSRVVVLQAAIAQQSFHNTVAGLAVFADGSRLIQSSAVVALGRRSTGAVTC